MMITRFGSANKISSKKRRHKIRKTRGGALLELASIAWIIPIFAMLSLNAALVGFAAWTNDAACRDVARAAAQQPDAKTAKIAALKALKAFIMRSQFALSPVLLLKDPDFKYEVFPDDSGKPQLDQGPYVKVTTSMEVRLPVPILFANDGLSQKLLFNQSYTYPILSPGESSNTGISDTAQAGSGSQLTL